MEVIIDGIHYSPTPAKAEGEGFLSALGIRFDSDAGDGITIRDYLHTLLETLWAQGEGFSGKRPFGNSGWEYELYRPLIEHGFVTGQLDVDGYVDSVDKAEAEAYVFDLIRAVFYGVENESS